MSAVMNETDLKRYQSRPYKAYAPDGTEVFFDNLVDRRQGLEMHNLTLDPPGAPAKDSAPFGHDYDAKSSETIRELCIARNIVGYMTLNKSQQIAALREADRRDEAARRAGSKAAKADAAKE